MREYAQQQQNLENSPRDGPRLRLSTLTQRTSYNFIQFQSHEQELSELHTTRKNTIPLRPQKPTESPPRLYSQYIPLSPRVIRLDQVPSKNIDSKWVSPKQDNDSSITPPLNEVNIFLPPFNRHLYQKKKDQLL